MSSLVSCRWVVASMLAWTSLGAAQDSKSPTGGAEKTLNAVEQLRQAVIDWRTELGPDAKLDANTVRVLRSRLQALGRELEPLLSEPRAESPAPVRQPVAADMQVQWVKDLRALGAGAAERRTAAVTTLKDALAGADPAARLAALRAFSETGDIRFDRTPFRALILPLTESERGETLRAALYALYQTDRQPGDLARVQTAYARNPEALAQSASHLLFLFGGGVIDGDSERIVLELLAAHDRNTRREALRGLWGAKVTPALATRLIELADDPESHGDAIYFGLSTLSDKNEAVIDTLIATLSDPDWTNNGQRALWGLGHGVPEALQPKIAAALVEFHNTRVDPRTRRTCAELVRRYGGDEMATKLEQ